MLENDIRQSLFSVNENVKRTDSLKSMIQRRITLAPNPFDKQGTTPKEPDNGKAKGKKSKPDEVVIVRDTK